MNHAASLMERYSARVYHVAARSLVDAGSKHDMPFTSGSPNRTRPFTRGGGASPPIVGTLDDRLVSKAKPRSSIRWPPDRLSCSELSRPSSSFGGSGSFDEAAARSETNRPLRVDAATARAPADPLPAGLPPRKKKRRRREL